MIDVPHVPHRRTSRFRASAIASILTSRDRLGCAARPQTAMTRTNERPHKCSGVSTQHTIPFRHGKLEGTHWYSARNFQASGQWNACSPTDGHFAVANWTERACKPG